MTSEIQIQEKKIQCLKIHLQEYQRQVETIQQELERTRCKLNACTKEQDDIRRVLVQKEDAIKCLEADNDHLKYEVREKEKSHERQSCLLQDQLVRVQEQLQQRDAALMVCRNEVKSHLATMEEVKANFACEVKQRDTLMCQLKEDMKKLYEELKCKSEEGRQLDRNVLDLKAKLGQATAKLNEADVAMTCLQEKMQQQQQLFTQEKQQAVEDVEEFEKKLNQASNDILCLQNELRKSQRVVQERDNFLEEMTKERDNLEQELACERQECCEVKDKMNDLENDNKEICRLLQQKIRCIRELEQCVCMKKDEVERCRCVVEDLSTKLRKLNTAKGSDDGDDFDQDDLAGQLRSSMQRLSKMETEKGDLDKKLHYAVNEMERQVEEVKRLTCELEECHCEICEKESMICDLNRVLEHAEQDMECRMSRMEEQLQKYDKELTDKIRMVGECEKKCCLYQQSLSEKDMELEQMEQKMLRSRMEVDCLANKMHELEESRNCLQKNLSEERAQLAEVSQENYFNKEMLRCTSQDAADLKRNLCHCQKELAQVRRDADDMYIQIQEKDMQISTLVEEKNCVNAKMANLQCRLEDETKQLLQQTADIKFQLENQVNQLTMSQNNMEEVNCNLKHKVSSTQRQLTDMEKNFYQKMNALNQEISCLQEKLSDKEDQLQSTKDCVNLRDSEIMRLKLRLCDVERCTVDRCYSSSMMDCLKAQAGHNRSGTNSPHGNNGNGRSNASSPHNNGNGFNFGGDQGHNGNGHPPANGESPASRLFKSRSVSCEPRTSCF